MIRKCIIVFGWCLFAHKLNMYATDIILVFKNLLFVSDL